MELVIWCPIIYSTRMEIGFYNMKSGQCYRVVSLLHSQVAIFTIPQCSSPISHNASFCNRNVDMCARFCYKMVHCGIFVMHSGKCEMCLLWRGIAHNMVKVKCRSFFKAESRLAPSQWETSLQSNAVSQWLGTNVESALFLNIWNMPHISGSGQGTSSQKR